MRGLRAMGVAVLLLCAVGVRADFRADLTKAEGLKAFSIVRPDPSHYKLDTAAGRLVITTQAGDIFEMRNDCRNLFYVPAPAGDFEVTLTVARFIPTAPVQHLSLGIFQDDDKLVRLTPWWDGQARALTLNSEDDAVQAAVKHDEVDFGDQPFRLRLTRKGKTISAAWAKEGGEWNEWGSVEWDGVARRIGFYAANSNVGDVPEIEAIVSGFEVKCDGPLPAVEAPAPEPKPLITDEQLLRYHAVRGFDYVPSYAKNGLVMWHEFDAKTWDSELGWVENLHGNTIRIWLDPRAYEADAAAFLRSFEQALAIAAKHKLRVIPTLFNCWPSVKPSEWGFGHLGPRDMNGLAMRRYEPYVRATVGAHRTDARVLMWDVINEPEFNGEASTSFVLYYAGVIHGVGATQPVTVGFASWPSNERFAAALDVLTLHIYAADEAGYEAAIEGLKAVGRRVGKPVVCNECVVGAVDDEKHRANCRAAVTAMEKERMGYTVWALVDGYIAASRPDRPEGGNGYQSFFHADGKARAAVAELKWRGGR